MLKYFFFADGKCLLLFFGVFPDSFEVGLCSGSYNRFERLYYFAVIDNGVTHCDLAALHAARGFDYCPVALLKRFAVRVEVVYLTHLFKSYSDNFCHLYVFLSELFYIIYPQPLAAYSKAR